MSDIIQNRYRITGELGSGAMGVVYQAIDEQTGDEVTIKVLPPALARDPVYLKRFEREAGPYKTLTIPVLCPSERALGTEPSITS